MIQRIQSIFLALLAILMFSMIFLPIWSKINPASGQEVAIDAMQMVYKENGIVKTSSANPYLGILAGVISAVAVGSLFSYKNRKRQILLNLINAFLLLVICCVQAYLIFGKGINLFDPQMQGAFGTGFYMPFGALLLNSASNRFIQRDEKLVKSIDRLR
jgi:hypothetical protein